jgi:hypothetical protein
LSLIDTVNSYGEKICEHFKSNGSCAFAPAEETAGFLDTSPERGGTRGIAFLCDKIRADFDGMIKQVDYSAIKSVELVESYESPYADELVIKGEKTEIRVSDYSLNKPVLKELIEELCQKSESMTEETLRRERAECSSAAADRFVKEQTEMLKAMRPAMVVDAEKPAVPTNYTPAEISEEKIEWISGAHIPPEEKEEKIEWISGAHSSAEEDDGENGEELSESAPEEAEEEENLDENMTREQTMAYLLSSINEINAPASDDIPKSTHKREPIAHAADMDSSVKAAYENIARAVNSDGEIVPPASNLTPEPPSDDIYIKASRSLREICESGKLSYEKLENAVKEGLLPAADLFMQATENPELIPSSLLPRIAELKAASGRMDEYFALGEDIAARVMFFMMYQMLSYADRIAQTAETKERLNSFFCRYGASLIVLSMLDIVS